MPAKGLGKSARGFTLLEVLLGITFVTIGVISIMSLFPFTLRANEQAELRTLGASLAMMKIEEIRRDNDAGNKLINAIRTLPSPTPPRTFPTEPRLAYRFSSTTMLFVKRNPDSGAVIDDPDDPRDDPGIARVIIQESPQFKSDPQILDEFRFN